MFAIISDIHGNLEALQAVLADIERRGIKRVLCLGDVVGYGASPKECLDLVIERCELTLCGNHDHAVFYEPANFNPGAERACYWTRQVFEDEPKKSLRDRRWAVLGRLPIRHEESGLLMVHASPRRPINEYLFAEDVYTNPNKILANFERLEAQHLAALVGHTHVPGVFLDDPYFESPSDLPEMNFHPLNPGDKAIINVGSVGQPRDRDIRASYVVVYENGETPPGMEDLVSRGPAKRPGAGPKAPGKSPSGNGGVPPERRAGVIEFVRIEYDVDAAVRKILNEPELDDFLGTRLLDGR